MRGVFTGRVRAVVRQIADLGLPADLQRESEGNHRARQAAGFGAAAPVFDLRFAWSQQPVGLRGADLAHLPPHRGWQLVVLGFIVRQPEIDQSHQALAARLFRGLPEAPEHLRDFQPILRRPAFAHGGIAAPASARIEQLDGVFVAVAELLAHFIDQARAALPPASRVTLPQPRQHLFSDFLTHRHRSGLPVSSFLSQRPFSSSLLPPLRCQNF